jgi:hypothetical protein
MLHLRIFNCDPKPNLNLKPIQMKPFFTRVFLLLLFLFPLFKNLYSQCGTAPGSGTTTVSTANQILNTYYPGTGNPVSGATTLTVGARDSRGNTTNIANGDMVVIMQMQGAEFNSTNSDAYGNGVAGGDASGYLSSNLVAGKYEYNIVSGYNSGTGVVTFSYGLAHNYHTRAYSTTTGIQSYQVIRVPRHYRLTIDAGASITAPAWNGSSGGVIVLEASDRLSINGSVTANALGFRGGGGKRFTGVSGGNTNGSTALTNTDFRWNSPVTTAANTTGGAKGEGIAGTPAYYLTNGATNATTATVEGYINGSLGRGAPGNAGGGGTDGDVVANQYNPGGGGGGNGGAGGRGGSGWDGGAANPNTYNTGGNGGAAYTQASLLQLVMGGGGGAGTSNNSTAGTTDYLSSGACGGGIIIMRALRFAGSGSVTANGAGANNVSTTGVTDAAGGGGAGGTIVVLTNQTGGTSTQTFSVTANGGKGGDMTTHFAHGPGGGGGGGVVITNVVPSGSITVNGGANGLTRSGTATGPLDDVYNSASGTAGVKRVLTTQPVMVSPGNPTSQCGVLPITLSLWNGVYKNNKTYLSWQTDAGINFSHFVVERSADGVHYSSLGQVAATTSAALILQYSFVDIAPAGGLNYYRLKMVDVDGSYKYSVILTIRTDAKGFSVTASPNPFTHQVVISIESATDETVHFRVYNSDGKLVWRKTSSVTAGTNAQYFNELQSLPKGIYFIKVNKQNTVAELKLIKQ